MKIDLTMEEYVHVADILHGMAQDREEALNSTPHEVPQSVIDMQRKFMLLEKQIVTKIMDQHESEGGTIEDFARM